METSGNHVTAATAGGKTNWQQEGGEELASDMQRDNERQVEQTRVLLLEGVIGETI